MPTVAHTRCPALTTEHRDIPTRPPREPHATQWERLQLPPLNSARQSAESVPRAKHISCPLMPVALHVGSVVAKPPVLRKPCQAVPLKRLTSTGCVLLVVFRVFTAQITPPAPSPAQPGAEIVFAVRLPNALQTVPLNPLHVSPPMTLRATHNT